MSDEYFKYKQYLLKQGKFEEAIRLTMSFYPKAVAHEVEQWMRRLLDEYWRRPASQQEMQDLSRGLGIFFDRAQNSIITGVRRFSTDVIAKYCFKMHGITRAELQKAILDGTVNQFESYIKGAMANTPATVLQSIREIQREWILRNQKIRFSRDMDAILYRGEDEFKQMLKRKYRPLFDQIEKGQILKSRTMGDGNVRSFTLSEYVDMSVRATVMNVDRNSAEIAANFYGDRVVEYYLRDTRPVKTEEREVCANILGRRIKGKALLALDEDTARVLGIMTIDHAKREGAMFIHCRHSIRRIDAATRNEINKALHLAGLVTDVGEEE